MIKISLREISSAILTKLVYKGLVYTGAIFFFFGAAPHLAFSQATCPSERATVSSAQANYTSAQNSADAAWAEVTLWQGRIAALPGFYDALATKIQAAEDSAVTKIRITKKAYNQCGKKKNPTACRAAAQKEITITIKKRDTAASAIAKMKGELKANLKIVQASLDKAEDAYDKAAQKLNLAAATLSIATKALENCTMKTPT